MVCEKNPALPPEVSGAENITILSGHGQECVLSHLSRCYDTPKRGRGLEVSKLVGVETEPNYVTATRMLVHSPQMQDSHTCTHTNVVHHYSNHLHVNSVKETRQSTATMPEDMYMYIQSLRQVHVHIHLL